jgi:predicted RecA/RadA family phage recombinase
MGALAAPFDVPQKHGEEIRIQAAAVKNYRGGAAAVLMGTGYATPLVPATAGHQFVGVYLENNDNSGGVAGTIANGGPLSTKSSWVRIAREGIFAFNQSGITQASVGALVFFSDDNTVTLTPGNNLAGTIVAIDEANTVAWVDIGLAVMPYRSAPIVVSASGAINPHASATYVITKAGVAALTLAAPTATTDDGVTITFTSNTANAHTVTATGLYQTGAATVNLATLAAFAGAGFTIYAYQGKWNVIATQVTTYT